MSEFLISLTLSIAVCVVLAVTRTADTQLLLGIVVGSVIAAVAIALGKTQR